ncbi:MAG: MBL fold metallo-hydrolase [bacterium]
MRLCSLLVVASLLMSCMPLPALETRREAAHPIAESNAPGADLGSLQIEIPYVGQGDATLFRLPDGKTLLVDAGPPGAGKEYLLPLLRRLDIRRIDALVISHYDLDHLGGVPGLIAGEDGTLGSSDDIEVGLAYDRGGQPWDNSPGYPEYLTALDAKKIPRHTLSAGESLDLDPNVKITCMAANGTVADKSGEFIKVDLSVPAYSGKENAASIALLFEFGDFRYLTAGDLTGGGSLDGFLTPDVETPLGQAVEAVDVVHVNHHGSLSSSNERFIAATHPKAVVVQAGRDNPYHHPVPEVLERWQKVGAEVYSTVEKRGYQISSEGKVSSITPLN